MILFFAAVSFLGREEFYILLLPLVYWCIDRRIGIGLGYLSLLSAWLNNAVKYLFAIPRPADPRLVIDYPEPTPSFPSGHAQNAVTNWGYLALRFRKTAITIGAIVLIVLIGLSRMVLGVHFPQDVVGGWLIGLLLLAVYAWAEPRVTPWLAAQRRVVQLTLALTVPLLLFFVYPADTAGRYPAQEGVTAAGTLLGFSLGIFMERIWVRFTVAGSLGRRALRLLAGLVVVILFYAGPRLVLPEEITPYGLEAGVRVLRYALIGWVAAFLCPWLFLRLGLVDREPEAA
jgi:hypothetical protein